MKSENIENVAVRTTNGFDTNCYIPKDWINPIESHRKEEENNKREEMVWKRRVARVG